MADTQSSAINWLHSSSGRSKRSKITDQGCYVLEHVATGRFFLGQSEHVSKEVDAQLNQLSLGRHPSKLLNGLYSKDHDIRVFETACKSKKERKALLTRLRDEAYPEYLCINPRDVK
ncbi:hypothetical protein D9M68_18590 [compost metagenome]